MEDMNIESTAIDWASLDIASMGFANTDFIYGTDGTARSLSTFNTNFSAMGLIARNRFKWESKIIQPLERLSEYIEFLLFWLGQCCIVNENGEWRVKKCISNGKLGAFGHPTAFTTKDFDGSNTKIYPYEEVIWIENNAECLPTYFWLRKYCDRIAHIERVMDLNIDAQKTPYIIEAAPEIQLSVKNVFKQIRQMCEAIFVNPNKGGIRDKVKVLDLNAPYLVDKLYAQKMNEYNDALNLLGVNTIDEKRERLVTGEAEISEDLTENYIDIFYSTRLSALRQFNERAGEGALTLKVMRMKGAKENVELHNQASAASGGGVSDLGQ